MYLLCTYYVLTNLQVLTYSAQDKAYRVWEMTNYEPLYDLPEEEISEVKISAGMMLVVLSRCDGHIPLRILSMEVHRECLGTE